MVAMFFIKFLRKWHATVQSCSSCILFSSIAGPQLVLIFYKFSAVSSVEITLVCQVSRTSSISKTSMCFLKFNGLGLMEAYCSKLFWEEHLKWKPALALTLYSHAFTPFLPLKQDKPQAWRQLPYARLVPQQSVRSGVKLRLWVKPSANVVMQPQAEMLLSPTAQAESTTITLCKSHLLLADNIVLL